MENILIKLPSQMQWTEEEFFDFCQQNSDLKLERKKNGQIILGMPTGSKTGNKNVQLIFELELWNRHTKSGYVFDSSTGFTLPNGAVRSADISWVRKEVWENLSESQKEKFAPICPDFIIELMSESNNLKECQEKMEDYRESGCQEAWLIDMSKQKVWIYMPQEIKEINGFEQTLSAGNLLTGFVLDLRILC